MAKISTYVIQIPKPEDILLGTETDPALNNSTKNFTVQSIVDLANGGANVNTINSIVAGEPSGSDVVLNVVSLTQAEYDAGTKIATTLYIIKE